jgi:hypothetical protein
MSLISPKHFIAILLVLAGLSPSLSKALSEGGGGDWQSNGGTGVACFKTPEGAAAFDRLNLAKQALDDQTIRQISTLITLEHWEQRKENYPTDLSREQILARLQKRLQMSAPLFSVQLALVENRIHFESWAAKVQLDPTNDAEPERPITGNCRQIQLAVRRHIPRPVDQLPELHVDFDLRLWNLLSPLDQAMLELHERIYVLGRQVGHSDSLRTRRLVRGLLDENFWTLEADDPPAMARKVQNWLDFHLGNYVNILFSVMEPSPTPKPFTPLERLATLRTLVEKASAAKKVCMVKGGGTAEDCDSEMFTPKFGGTLTGAESFILTARWVFPRFFPNLPNTELFMVDWQDEEMKAIGARAFKYNCWGFYTLMEDGRDRGPKFAAAVRYCQDSGIGPITPAPKETDQN